MFLIIVSVSVVTIVIVTSPEESSRALLSFVFVPLFDPPSAPHVPNSSVFFHFFDRPPIELVFLVRSRGWNRRVFLNDSLGLSVMSRTTFAFATTFSAGVAGAAAVAGPAGVIDGADGPDADATEGEGRSDTWSNHLNLRGRSVIVMSASTLLLPFVMITTTHTVLNSNVHRVLH
jgi:hypothetical protein